MATIVKTPTSNNTNVAINNNDKNNNSPLNPPVSSLTSDTAITVDNEDREKDLERRLALLGSNTTDIITTTSTVTTAATATVTDEDNDSIEEKSEPKSVLSSPDNSNSDEKKKEEDQSSPPVLVEEKKKEEELKKNNDNVSLTPPEPSISNVTNTPPPTIEEAAVVQPSLPEPPPVEIVKPAAELVKPKIAKTSSVMKREALMVRFVDMLLLRVVACWYRLATQSSLCFIHFCLFFGHWVKKLFQKVRIPHIVYYNILVNTVSRSRTISHRPFGPSFYLLLSWL